MARERDIQNILIKQIVVYDIGVCLLVPAATPKSVMVKNGMTQGLCISRRPRSLMLRMSPTARIEMRQSVAYFLSW